MYVYIYIHISVKTPPLQSTIHITSGGQHRGNFFCNKTIRREDELYISM